MVVVPTKMPEQRIILSAAVHGKKPAVTCSSFSWWRFSSEYKSICVVDRFSEEISYE